MLVQWRPDLECGVAEIDTQHKEIFNRINALLEASQQGKGRAEIGQVLDFLAAYVVVHFTAEERFMQQTGYPNREAHRKLHQDFVADFTSLKQRFETDGATSALVIQVQRRVVDWLIHHIGREDKQVAAFSRLAGSRA